MPNQHALLSPSSSERWLHCPRSARLCEGMADTTSNYASEGTEAHALCEHLLLQALGRNTTDPRPLFKQYSNEMQEAAEGYVQYVMEQVADFRAQGIEPAVYVEQRLDLRAFIPDCMGTSDAIVVGGDTVIVVDFKFGCQPVPASSPQLRIYSLGVCELLSCLYDFTRVRTVIYQPRLSTVDEAEITKDDLYVFSDGSFAYSDVSLSSSYEAAKAAYNKAATAQATAQQALSNTEVIVGTQTASTGAWTGVASFSELKDGQQIVYWLPYAGSGNATLNLTLANGTTTGAKNCYYSGATRLTTHYAAGNAIHLTYRVNANVNGTNYTGWWSDANYDSNYYDRIRFNNAIIAKTAISASRLIVGDSGGYFHLAAGSIFDVDKPILWAASAIAASTTATTNYLSYPSCTLRNNAGSSWTATQYATLYLAGTLLGNSFVVASENWLTTAPANESLTYIALGYMYSTYQMYFYPEHPMYRLVDDVLTAVSQMAYEAQVAASNAQATADAARADFRRVVRIDNDGLHVGDNQSTGEVLIDSESVNVVMNGSKYSRFAGNYVQFGNYQLRRTTDGGLAFKMTDI